MRVNMTTALTRPVNVRKLLLFHVNQTQPAPNPVRLAGRPRVLASRVRALTTEPYQEIPAPATRANMTITLRPARVILVIFKHKSFSACS